MKFKKTAAIIFLILTISGCFTGCTKNKETKEALKDRDILELPYSKEVFIVNPAFVQLDEGSVLDNIIYSPLFTYNGVQINDVLADSIEFKDNREVKIKLREDLRWHDGTKLTSDDIIYTLEVILNPENSSPLRNLFVIGGKNIIYEKEDDVTVNITLPAPKSDFLFALSRLVPIPKHIFEGEESPYTSSKNLEAVGSGPFKLEVYEEGEYLKLSKYDDYYSGTPKLDGIEFKKYLNSSAEDTALSDGSLTMVKGDVDLFNKYKDNDHYNSYEFKEGKVNCIIFNQNNEAMKDVDVRKGLSHALNRKKLIQAAYGDEEASMEAKSIFLPETMYYREDNVEGYGYDLEAAKEFLKKSTVKLQKIIIAYNIEEQHHKEYAEKAGEQLSELGYKVIVDGLGDKEFKELFYSGSDKETSLYVTSYSLGMNPDDYKDMFRTEGNYNHYGYSNINIDNLWEQGYNEIDSEKMKDIYGEIQAMILEDAPIYLIDYDKSYVVASKKLKGIEEAKLTPVLIFQDWSKLSIKD